MARQDWNDCKEIDTFRQPSLSFLPMPSFQRRLESSGLNNPFPQSGNDDQRNDNQMRYPPKRGAY